SSRHTYTLKLLHFLPLNVLGCPRFDFLPGSWVHLFFLCEPQRTPRPCVIFFLNVIPTAVPRPLRHAVEGSRHNHRVLALWSFHEFRFSSFAFRVSLFEFPLPDRRYLISDNQFQFQLPSIPRCSTHPSPAPPSLYPSPSPQSCGIPLPYPCPACTPNCTGSSILPEYPRKSCPPSLSSIPGTAVPPSLSKSASKSFFRPAALPADSVLLLRRGARLPSHRAAPSSRRPDSHSSPHL